MPAFIDQTISTTVTVLSVPTNPTLAGIHGPDPQSFAPTRWAIHNPSTTLYIYGRYANNTTPATPVTTGGSTAADALKMDFYVVPGSVFELTNSNATSLALITSSGSITGVHVLYER